MYEEKDYERFRNLCHKYDLHGLFRSPRLKNFFNHKKVKLETVVKISNTGKSEMICFL